MRKTRASTEATVIREVTKPDEQWRQELTPEQYRVLRKAHTEVAFTGAYVHNHADGFYRCAGCGAPGGVPRIVLPQPAGVATSRAWVPLVIVAVKNTWPRLLICPPME